MFHGSKGHNDVVIYLLFTLSLFVLFSIYHDQDITIFI